MATTIAALPVPGMAWAVLAVLLLAGIALLAVRQLLRSYAGELVTLLFSSSFT